MAIDRSRRIANQVQQTLAGIIQHSLADVRQDKGLKLITLTDVRVTKDMRQATIYVSCVNSSKAEAESYVKILNEEKAFLRKELSHELNLRVTPSLHFRHDELVEHSARIESLLKNIQPKENNSDDV